MISFSGFYSLSQKENKKEKKKCKIEDSFEIYLLGLKIPQ